MWLLLGLPLPATSGDIKRIDCKYAPAAVAAYSSQQQNLLAIKPADDPRSQNAWKALLAQAERQLDDAIDQRIKCGK